MKTNVAQKLHRIIFSTALCAFVFICPARVMAIEKPLIFPIPQEMEVTGESFILDESISIIVSIQGFVLENVTEEEIAEVAEMPTVSSIEPDTVVTIQTDGRPPVYRELAGLEQVPYGTDRVNGGREYRGRNVAWVIDTGIFQRHFDLRVDKTRGTSFVQGEPTPNDGNGHGTQ